MSSRKSRPDRPATRPERFQRRTLPGAPPGTLIPDPTAPRGRMHLLAFGPDGYEEQWLDEPRAVQPFLLRWPVTWVNVDGVGDAALVAELGALFGLHRLALEDVLHVHQRAKAEPYGSYYFVVGRMPSRDDVRGTEQISFFFGERFVLTFQERPGGDCLDAVRTRIRSGWGRARCARPDCLFHALLDVIVDQYFPLVEDCGERLDVLEADVFEAPSAGVMPRIHAVKRDLLTVRRAMWPLRDAINGLLRDPGPLIGEETRVYLRDVHDHAIQIVDLVESYRDIASGLTEVYLSAVSQRTNEIVKVLTVISTLFIPLTFIAGVYGMNFDRSASPWNMPELGWPLGYPLVLLLMALVATAFALFFWRRGWFTSGASGNSAAAHGDPPGPAGTGGA